jgi:hypothetical protein
VISESPGQVVKFVTAVFSGNANPSYQAANRMMLVETRGQVIGSVFVFLCDHPVGPMLETVQWRVNAIRDYTAQAAAIPGPNAERIKEEGHLAAYDRDLRYIDRSAADLQARLLA